MSLASFIVYVDLAHLHFDEFYRTHSDFFLHRIQKKKEEEERTKLSTSYNNGPNIDSFLIVIFNVHIITVISSSTWSITSSDRADPSSN